MLQVHAVSSGLSSYRMRGQEGAVRSDVLWVEVSARPASRVGWGGVGCGSSLGGIASAGPEGLGHQSFKAEGGAEISPAVLGGRFPLLGLCCSGGWVLSLEVVLLCLLPLGGGTLIVAVKMSSGFSDSQSLWIARRFS